MVDAFTARPFGGNPAAICILPPGGRPNPAWMQSVAVEMNLSATAFLQPRPDRSWDLRWFTPTVEIELCGHATLASAHLLWEDGLLGGEEEARFHTRSGALSAARRGEGWIELNFPATPAQEVEAPAGLGGALGVTALRWVGKTRFDCLIELATETEVRSLQPDLTRLRQLAVRGVIVTAGCVTPARASVERALPRGRETPPRYDFVSRFFAPGSGLDEDPVTGSAHCALTPFWAERLGRKEMFACQASARGGELRLRLLGDRVGIAGHAVTVWRGALRGAAAG